LFPSIEARVAAGEAYVKFLFGAEETTLTPMSSTTSLTPENALYHASLTHEWFNEI
jgi:hypothetical protein